MSNNHTLFFPADCESRTFKWIFAAQLYLTKGDSIAKSKRVQDVKQAYYTFADPQEENNRRILEAALITEEENPAKVASRMGMSVGSVEAYEALFFNVYDRRRDHMYLRNLAYPGTKLEEYFEDQVTRGNFGKHLLRIGYNKGLDSVLLFSGFKPSAINEVSEQQASAAFKKATMMQGMLLADNGFLNFTTLHPALISAKAILQSGLIGGIEQTDDYDDWGAFSDIAEETIGNDMEFLRLQAERQADALEVAEAQ